MEAFGALIDIAKTRPDLFVIALLMTYGFFERQERQRQQKANSDLQGKMLEQNGETKESLSEMITLLRILTQGRH